LLAGNLVNSFTEEGLFRGVMLTHFRVGFTAWQANLLQAVTYGLWHLARPSAQRQRPSACPFTFWSHFPGNTGESTPVDTPCLPPAS
jgi:membrane protease YdiL (CAAX protease family)